MELSPRLALAARLCTPCRSVIDVGCDHAYLCIHLVEQGAIYAFAADIRPGPLASARANIAACGLSDRIRPVLCPGLEGFSPDDADTISICGMGGELIASILDAAPWTADGRHRLVLQPMTCAHRLRKWLHGHGFSVRREALAQEGRRLYVVLEAVGGAEDTCGAENGYYFTSALLSDPLFPVFARGLRRQQERARAGKRLAGRATAAEDAILKRLEELGYGA